MMFNTQQTQDSFINQTMGGSQCAGDMYGGPKPNLNVKNHPISSTFDGRENSKRIKASNFDAG